MRRAPGANVTRTAKTGVSRCTITPAARSVSTARSPSPGSTSTARVASRWTTTSKPARLASSAVCEHAVVEREAADVDLVDAALAQDVRQAGAGEPRVALVVRRLALVDDQVDRIAVESRVQLRARLPATQWTGHGPPCGTNEPWSGECQSRVATTRGASRASRLSTSITASPSATASAPPGQKSFWTSTTISASTSREYSHVMLRSRESLSEDLKRVLLSPEAAVQLDVHGRTDAAVLVPLYVTDGVLHAVFTRRREDLRRHPGEISFPGGRYEDGEPSLTATALREAEEEIGLPADAVEILGALQPTPTVVTGYAVYPFVGMIDPGRTWTISPREVAEVIELSLADLLAGYGRRRLVRRGLPIRTDTYLVDDYMIWGATARILADLFDRIGPLVTNGSAPR